MVYATHDGTMFIHERIDEIARKTPQARALRHGNTVQTYRQLTTRANHLALRIVNEVPARSVVAIWMDRSFTHIIAALAVIKAGSAFVWLEPTDPIDRIRGLIENASISLVLTDRAHHKTVAGIDATVMVVEPYDVITSTIQPKAIVASDDLAYVAFTSGTTGTPKGAMITHANLAALSDWHDTTFRVTADDRASHLAGLSFDAAMWEIWPYLAAGACVTLADDTTRTSPAALKDWLIEEQVTIAFVPTALAGPMLTAAWPRDCALRTMLVGGEALRTRPRGDLPFAVYNNYGVAECAVVSTSGLVVPVATDENNAAPSIGKPISGTDIHLLDAHHNPVRRGEEGEIWIGGMGVGRGYLGEPELTAAAFLEDTANGRGRIYRTGDRGRILPNGEIMHLGRHDDQCKIRGVRIETGEVAACLRQHDAVADVAVMLETDPVLGDHLVAYIVPTTGTAPTADELRAFLARSLPTTYLPARFATLAALPLTANGKIDKTALAAAAVASLNAARTTVAPSNPIEARLLVIVEAVLGLPNISTTDDFFLLGGHSLLATQVVLQSREAFGIDLTLRDLFEAPTVETLAELVGERLASRIAAMSDAQVQDMLSGVPA